MENSQSKETAYQKQSKLENSHELDLSSITLLERKQFLISGLYPLETTNKFSIFLHNIKFSILLIFSTVLFLSMTISLVLGVDNLSEVTAILYYLITQSAYLIKLIILMTQRWKLPLLEKHLENPISYKYYKIYGSKGLDTIIRICTFTANYFRVCVTFVLIFYILVPFMSKDISLPFAGWMPVDKIKYRGIIFAVQISCYTVSAYTNSSLDIFTAYYISIGVGQLRLLKTCLRNIDYTMGSQTCSRKLVDVEITRENRWVDENDGNKETNETKLPPESLEELLMLHEHAIEFINMIEDTFSYGIFIQFLASVAVICLTGFQMLVVSPASAEFILLLFYFTCMMCQVILYCWYGNEIQYESSGIGEACYMSNWYEGTQKTKNVLFLIMERSKRNIFLTAGKFFILSLTTLVLIIKSSYSYFAVLRRVYKDN